MITALVISCVLFVSVCSGQNAIVRISPSTQNLMMDSIITLHITIETGEWVRASSVTLAYDPLVLQCTGASKGDFFPAGGSLFFFAVDSVAGTIRCDEAIIGSGARSGTASLAEIRLKGRTPGSSQLNLAQVHLRDSANRPLSVSVHHGVAHVGIVNSVATESVARNDDVRCFPNPFNSQLNITVSRPAGRHSLAVTTITGELVEMLSGEGIDGSSVYRWNGRNRRGETVASGMYIISLIGEHTRIVRKVQFIK